MRGGASWRMLPPVPDGSTKRRPWLEALALLTALGMGLHLTLSFFDTPIEAVMGIVQKIFYIHVPSAYGMYIGFGTCAVASALYLWKGIDRADALAAAGAEVGVLFATIVLVTGPLWARKAWGVYWTWEPRLTTTFVSVMIYAGVQALRSSGGTGEAERRFASGLALAGLPTLALVHFAVQRWGGVHPAIRSGGLDPTMARTLGVGFTVFTLLAILLLALRYRLERARLRVLRLEDEAYDLGLLGDES